ncbi:hypothetical protein ACJX0J_016018, partial [Zea mays]
STLIEEQNSRQGHIISHDSKHILYHYLVHKFMKQGSGVSTHILNHYWTSYNEQIHVHLADPCTLIYFGKALTYEFLIASDFIEANIHTEIIFLLYQLRYINHEKDEQKPVS